MFFNLKSILWLLSIFLLRHLTWKAVISYNMQRRRGHAKLHCVITYMASISSTKYLRWFSTLKKQVYGLITNFAVIAQLHYLSSSTMEETQPTLLRRRNLHTYILMLQVVTITNYSAHIKYSKYRNYFWNMIHQIPILKNEVVLSFFTRGTSYPVTRWHQRCLHQSEGLTRLQCFSTSGLLVS